MTREVPSELGRWELLKLPSSSREDTSQVRLLHELAKIDVTFDDPHLVSRAGLVPVMALAQRAGLDSLVEEHVRISRPCGVNAQVKVPCLVAGMIAGADSIDDMDVLRHGALPVLFGGVRAPSTLGSFLRSFTWGNVLQLGKVHREFLAELARRAPLLPGADVLAFIDVDSQQKRVYGHHKQGAAFGFTKIGGKGLLVRGLNVLAATVCTPLSAPAIIPATRQATFTCAFTPHGWPIRTCSAARSPRPARWANPMTGTRPACDTRCGSSNVAWIFASSCNNRICEVSSQPDDGSFSNSHRPSSEGTFRVDAPEWAPNYTVDSGLGLHSSFPPQAPEFMGVAAGSMDGAADRVRRPGGLP